LLAATQWLRYLDRQCGKAGGDHRPAQGFEFMQTDFVEVPGNPLPGNAQCGFLDAASGVKLRYGQFAPSGPASGTVLLLQGRGECMERQFETIRDLNARGLHVLSFDWRGQGGSPRAQRPGRRGHVDSFSSYLEDLEMVVQDAMLPDCPPPYFMFGNSMGAHVGLLCIARHNWFDAAVMIAPFIEVAPDRLPRWFKLAVTGAMTVFGMGRVRVPLYRDGEPDEESFPGNPLTSDRLRYNRNIRLWRAAQELSAHVPSAGWAFAALRSCARLQKLDDRTPLKCPALLVVAGQDVVVSNEATQQFARFVPGAAPVVINGARHDILCEQDIYRDQFFAAADAFLADRLRGSPAQ
jgi:lysophospholipase